MGTIVFASLFLCCWLPIVCAQGPGDISLSLNGTLYQNNGIVDLEDIGEGGDALLCTTANTACCSRSESPGAAILGQWYYPNGSAVADNIVDAQGDMWEFYRTRGPSIVRLNRRRGGVTGIYRCEIPDTTGVNQTMYIGVYAANTGQVSLSGEIVFQLNNAATPVFTLTCTSTGGPATTVSWRRDGTLLRDDSNHDIMSQVTDPVTATYTNTLTVTGRHDGLYQCSVSNIRTPSGISRSLTIGDPPTDLNVTQVGPTSIRVSWTASVSGAAVTGYRISYGGGTDQRSVDVGASATEHTITIPQPQSRLNYSISIIARSTNLPISTVRPIMVTVDPPPIIPAVIPGVPTSTSAEISWNQQAYVNVYEILFERATGDQQLGECPAYEHRGRVLVAGTTTTHNLTGLQEFSTYFITVTAVNRAGRNESAPVTMITLTTAPSHGPQLLGAVTTMLTNITIAWNSVNCTERNSNITGYVIRYAPPSSGGIDSVTVAGTGDAGGRVTLDRLTPSTHYSIQVAAVNSDGAVGEFSAISVHTSTGSADTQTLGVGSLVGGVVGTFAATTLLYIVVLLIVIGCSRKRRRHDTEEPPNQNISEIELKECQAYGHTTNRSQANEETIYMN